LQRLVRVVAVLALAVVVAGCGRAGRRPRNQSSPAPVPTAAAKVTTVHGSSTISGVIAPLQNVAISSSLVEPTDAVYVNEGDRVRRGQVLALLDTADLQANLAQAQSTVVTNQRNAASAQAKVDQTRYTAQLQIGQGSDAVNVAHAALMQAQQTLSQAQVDLGRDRSLLTNGYISQQAVDQQSTAADNDAAQVRSAEASLRSAITNEQVNGTSSHGLQAANVASSVADARAALAEIQQAQAQVQQFQAQIAKATVTSPVDGVIVNRNLNPGEYPGSRTIFTVQELSSVYAELNASSGDVFSIPTGAAVTLSVPSAPSHTYHGKVVAVLGQVAPGSTNFTVKVLLANPDQTLQSGLPVTGTATLPPVTGLGIPTTAFLDDTHTSVMIADDELVDVVAKTAHVKEIASDGTTSIVTGLKAGQHIVSNGQLGLSDGQSLADR
jgi:multidrug efflux pump subunit AcrA (membrane-fusion protein)